MQDNWSTSNGMQALLGIRCWSLLWRQECLATYIKSEEMRQTVVPDNKKQTHLKMKTKLYLGKGKVKLLGRGDLMFSSINKGVCGLQKDTHSDYCTLCLLQVPLGELDLHHL